MTRWGYTARSSGDDRRKGLCTPIDDPGPIRHAYNPNAPQRRHRLTAVCGASLVGLGGATLLGFRETYDFDPRHPRACPRCVKLGAR